MTPLVKVSYSEVLLGLLNKLGSLIKNEKNEKNKNNNKIRARIQRLKKNKSYGNVYDVDFENSLVVLENTRY